MNESVWMCVCSKSYSHINVIWNSYGNNIMWTSCGLFLSFWKKQTWIFFMQDFKVGFHVIFLWQQYHMDFMENFKVEFHVQGLKWHLLRIKYITMMRLLKARITRGVSHCGLAIYIKNILRQKKNYVNSSNSPCKNIILKKSSKRNQKNSRYYNFIRAKIP